MRDSNLARQSGYARRMDTRVDRFTTADGRRIYRLPVTLFVGFLGNAYLICGGESPILVDCGSGMEPSNEDLENGFQQIRERFDEPLTLADIGRIVITHGHIDHFGGLGFLRRHTDAPVAVHALDRRVLSGWEERVIVASKKVANFLAGAGIRDQLQDAYMQMYLSTKGLVRSTPVDETFTEGEILGGELETIHVPGHCPGQVCVRVDDILLTGDHVLEKISPHISPEAITLSTGIGHYLSSLRRVERLTDIRLGLGGHQGEMHDVTGRAEEIRRLTEERLEGVADFCSEPRSIADVSREIFGTQHSYHVLLALLESGALVEHLYQYGELVAANAGEIEAGHNPVILYRRAR